MHIFILLLVLILAFVFFGPSSSTKPEKTSPKDEIQQYFSEFNMFLCLKNKLLLYPPKELNVQGKYHVLNLQAKSKLLPHKNINGNKITFESLRCTECLHRCPLNLSDIVDLKLSFDHFREFSDEELKNYLSETLTEEQFEILFEEAPSLDIE